MPPNENSAIGPYYFIDDLGEWHQIEALPDAPIADDPPGGSFGLHFDPNETITLDLNERKARRLVMALIGWRARGPLRYRTYAEALKRYGTSVGLQEG